MSFRCKLCGSSAEAGSSPTKVVVKKRDRIYPEREKANPKFTCYKLFWNSPWPPGSGHWAIKKDESSEKDPGGKGWEIAEEVDACEACAEEQGFEEIRHVAYRASMQA